MENLSARVMCRDSCRQWCKERDLQLFCATKSILIARPGRRPNPPIDICLSPTTRLRPRTEERTDDRDRRTWRTRARTSCGRRWKDVGVDAAASARAGGRPSSLAMKRIRGSKKEERRPPMNLLAKVSFYDMPIKG